MDSDIIAHESHQENKATIRRALDELTTDIQANSQELANLQLGESRRFSSDELTVIDGSGKNIKVHVICLIEHCMEHGKENIKTSINVCQDENNPLVIRLYWVETDQNKNTPWVCSSDIFSHPPLLDTGIAKILVKNGEQVEESVMRAYSKRFDIQSLRMRVIDSSTSHTKRDWTSNVVSEMPGYKEVGRIYGDRAFEHIIPLASRQ